jgi:YgiT-type zinc finger domain-containing protein
MHRDENRETVTYKGASLTYPQPGWHCETCGDGILEGSDNEHHDAALREVMGLTAVAGAPAAT